MFFGRIQKLTLLDYPDKTACTLFTAGCNFRCPFCQNSPLLNLETSSKEQMHSSEEILGFLETRKGLLDGVCISGGEPLQSEGLEEFISSIKNLGFLVKLDTNGSFPHKLERLIAHGMVDYIAMDIKNSPEKYAQTIGVHEYDISPVMKSIDMLLQNKVPYEFRTTVVRELHTAEDLLSLANRICGAENYYLQRFIDSEGVLQSGLNGYTDEEMHELLRIVKQVIPAAGLRGV
ncbi:MAG: anaerobic ribonucleoside-triphosphate reductase activating protein [Oscillospiraceae bacterium]|nr:anaerobic ribonucleoside-triphosphate reductase activating protein [Oscillospiraceae bacterium]